MKISTQGGDGDEEKWCCSCELHTFSNSGIARNSLQLRMHDCRDVAGTDGEFLISLNA
jgi:hypothetical protein